MVCESEAVRVSILSSLFFADRLKVQLREQGARHDLVDAVFALEGQDDLLLIVRRVEALGKFLDTEDGKNLLAGYKRATNIIRIEEKKDSRDYTGAPEPKLYKQDEEKALARAIEAAKAEATRAVEKEDFAAAMTAMAKLRPAVDAFFDKVTVNVEDQGAPREPAEAAQRNPRRHPRRGGFFEDRGVIRHSGARAKPASPESISPAPVDMDSGLAASRRPGMTIMLEPNGGWCVKRLSNFSRVFCAPSRNAFQTRGKS